MDSSSISDIWCSKCKAKTSNVDIEDIKILLKNNKDDEKFKSCRKSKCSICSSRKFSYTKRLIYMALATQACSMDNSKVCNNCGISKVIDDYHKTYNVCKSCCKTFKLIYRKNNRNKINEYERNRRKIDPQFKLIKNLRSRLRDALKGKTKSQSTKDLLGIDYDTFIKWIEYQLDSSMTMDNYGSEWVIDHVIPISSFNLLDEDELKRSMNWINLRPMLKLDNISKSNKIDKWLLVCQEVKAKYFLNAFFN